MQNIPNTQTDPEERDAYVKAAEVAARYGVSSRYILKLAAGGVIPSLRIGKQCVRFDLRAVSRALENDESIDVE
jgi:excisionase family DNA binding protein